MIGVPKPQTLGVSGWGTRGSLKVWGLGLILTGCRWFLVGLAERLRVLGLKDRDLVLKIRNLGLRARRPKP